MSPDEVSSQTPAPQAPGQIRVVLVEPTGPLNVGSVARAMANFGLSDLRIVGGPRLDHPQCLEMAVSGRDILLGATRCESLDQALEGTTFVMGTTARQRHRMRTLRPPEAAKEIVEEAARGEVALVFGREDHGLTSAELRSCHRVVAVETAPECRALNLGQAVLLLAYEIFGATGNRGIVADSDWGPLLRKEQKDRLHGTFLEALTALGILHPGTEVFMRQAIERLLTIGPMQTRDARVLFTMTRRIVTLLGDERPTVDEDDPPLL